MHNYYHSNDVQYHLCLYLFFYVAGFFLLEESLHTKEGSLKKRDSHPGCEEDSSTGSDPYSISLETNDSSGSLLSNDSGIELKMNGSDSDTELIDVTQSKIYDHDDELMIVESDTDTDSDFERVNSDTELLVSEHKTSNTTSKCSKVVKHFIPSCLVSECGPHQCYGRVRNSLMDSYRCVVVCVECFKGCGKSHHHGTWSTGEVRDHSKSTFVKRMYRSVLNLICLILDRRVFLSTLLYGVLAFFAIICNEVN